ncbi:mitogen-activated protein kinase kinase kinase 7-like [Drosophila albomicans]|uniref:Mitogen-activated protein kinase kinase kinase 7-like n=1 Tax=Drosophila albomicans TaxID=7291 RepID=A0A9C6SZF2_DROAB|nr:mitogen-activated protein kinase kinase kinase 7-like [Drosophila albomicans]
MNAIQKDEWKNITIEEEPIGCGTFGEVYTALWKTEKGPKIIAVKRYRSYYSIKSKLTIYSLQLKHDHILKLYCLSIDDNRRLIELMEYADCGNLYSAVHDCTVNIVNNKYETFSLMWMLHCAKGLKFLHDQNIIHRDINTRKLLLFNKYQTLKISLSQTVRTESTVMTEIVGTFVYMAPKIMEGMQYTKKCDFFSYGIMLWEVMSRKKPFYDMREHHSFAICRKVLQGLRPNINDVIDIQNSDEIKILITKCWDADPQKRPSMEEVVAIMEKYSFYYENGNQILNIMKKIITICTFI